MRKKIVVIGGGLAGSLLCNKLVKDADVTLLEIGRKNSIQYPKIAFDRKKLAEVATFCYGGGGTTNLWHNGLIPLSQGDIVSRDFAEVVAEALPFTDAAASALFFSRDSYSLAYAGLMSEISGVATRLGIAADGVDCLVYPKKFRRLEVDSRVNEWYSVAKIGFVCNDRRITTVTCTAGGRAYSVDSDVVIVAAGALGSPKIIKELLTASGNSSDGLGTGFIDHPMGFVGKVRFNKEVAGLVRQLSVYDKGDYVSRNAIRLRSACGRYTCCAFFRPALTMDNRLDIYKYKSLLGASSGLARIRNGFSFKIFHPDIVAEIVAHLFGITIPSRTFNILFIAEQKRGGNRVYYDGDDLKVDWSISADELAVYRALLKKLEGVLRPVAEELNLVTDITADWLWSAAHHSCTVSLGNSPEDLVDKDLKLKMLDNVFVCDGSIIQEHSYANTGLAIGQLAFRLARRVLDEQ
ncbi:MAG TPA: hypothetical protein DDY32_10930 [Desulfobulbaceae bacterium]|nr:hypothetical protein [Desulfobulbaceae bacterium]